MEGTLRGSIADVLEGQISGSLELLAGEPVLENLSVSSNGVYEPRTGVDGFNKVTVSVPEPELETLNVTQNGTYTPGSGVDGFDEVNVNVPSDEPVLDSIEINENGHYTPPSGTDGYDDITVYVPYVSQGTTINDNGTYTPPSGVDGFSQVIVDVPNAVQGLVVTENGTYTPPVGSGVVGYSPVTVNVTPPAPILELLTVAQNGTYNPTSPAVGFSQAIVNCPVPEQITLFDGGTFPTHSDITLSAYNYVLENNMLKFSGAAAGLWVSSQSINKNFLIRISLYNPNTSNLRQRCGRCTQNAALPGIMDGTGRINYTAINLAEGFDDYITIMTQNSNECVYLANLPADTSTYYVKKVSAYVINNYYR